MAQRQNKKKEKWNNKIPDWLNIILVACIFGCLIYGSIIFLKRYDHGTGDQNFMPFLPSSIFAAFYFVILFIVNLFANADLANVMMVTLLIGGFTLLGIGIFNNSESIKKTSFEFAAAFLGLAFGIPFGEKLRTVQEEIKNNKQ